MDHNQRQDQPYGRCLPEIGEVWTARDAESGSRIDLLWMTRFLTGHCHVGGVCSAMEC